MTDPILFPGDNDAGGRDDVAGTVEGAVMNAEARFREHQSDTYGQASQIGDLMALPDLPNLSMTTAHQPGYEPPAA